MKLKWITLSIIALGPCKQSLYDALYLTALRASFERNIHKIKEINREGGVVIAEMSDNENIDILRELCHGQKSTYEKDLK